MVFNIYYVNYKIYGKFELMGLEKFFSLVFFFYGLGNRRLKFYRVIEVEFRFLIFKLGLFY